jgi:hypothetical protein
MFPNMFPITFPTFSSSFWYIIPSWYSQRFQIPSQMCSPRCYQ